MTDRQRRVARACRRVVAGAAVLCGLASGAAPVQAWTRVTLTAEDGAALAASVWEPPGRAAAGIVLVHGPSRTRHDWDRLGDQLAARGFVVIAVDLRGHGESPSGGDGDLATMARDVTAAARYLLARPDAPSRLGLAGSSAGGTLGVIAAQAVPALRAFVWISTPLDFRGLRIEEPLRRIGECAALAIASNEDVYAVRSARALAETTPGARELMLVDSAGHGARILAGRPDLLPAVVDWFARTLL